MYVGIFSQTLSYILGAEGSQDIPLFWLCLPILRSCHQPAKPPRGKLKYTSDATCYEVVCKHLLFSHPPNLLEMTGGNSKVLLSIKLRHVCTVKKKLHKHLLKKKGLIHDCKQAKRDFKLRLKHLQTGQNQFKLNQSSLL